MDGNSYRTHGKGSGTGGNVTGRPENDGEGPRKYGTWQRGILNLSIILNTTARDSMIIQCTTSSLKPVTDVIPWAPESCNFWYSEGLPKIAVTAIVGLSYLSLHPSLFSVRVAGLTAYDFTSRGRSQVLGNKESMELGMGREMLKLASWHWLLSAAI